MKQSKETKACCYLRVSTDRTVDTSIPIQKKRLEELAESEGYEIIQWYKDEGISGSKDPEKRLDWMRLLSDAKAGAEWEVILCYNRSRFSRLDPIEEGFAKQILREAGKRLYCAAEGMMDWDTSTGIIIDTIHSTQAHDYAVTLAKNSLDGKINAFLEGRAYGQKCPYGLARSLVDPDGKVHEVSRKANFTKPREWEQTFIPGDPEEVATVRWLFEMYATRDVGQRWLAEQLNAQKVRAPDGGMWAASLVRRMLMNPSYVGDTVVGRWKVGKHAVLDGTKVVKGIGIRRRVFQGPGVLRENTHEGIISRELWNTVQAKIRRRTRNLRHLSRGEGGYALKDVLICGHCGNPMYGRRNSGIKKSGIVSYVCGNGLRIGKHSGCSQWRIGENLILPVVIGKVAEEIDLRLLALKSAKPPSPREASGKDQIATLGRKLAEMDKKIKKGGERFLTNENPKLIPVLQKELDEWQAQRDLLEEQLEEAKQVKPDMEMRFLELQKFFAAAKQQLIHVQMSPQTGAKFEEGVAMTADALRETLHRHGFKVFVWWKQRSARRWDVDRVRIMVGVPEDPAEKLKTRRRKVKYAADRQEGGAKTPEKAVENGLDAAAQSDTYRSLYAPDCAALLDLTFLAKDLFPKASYAAILPVMQEMQARGVRFSVIADHLNRQGLTTLSGKPWDRYNVRKILHRKELWECKKRGPKPKHRSSEND